MRRAEATWHIGMESLFSGSSSEGPSVSKETEAIKVGQYNVNIVKMLQGIYKTTSKKNKPPRKAPQNKSALPG